MDNTVDIEKLKLLAERYNEINDELKEIKKEMNQLVSGTQVAIHERLSDGGFVIYEKPENKEVISKNLINAMLIDIIMRLSKGELEKAPNIEELKTQIALGCRLEKTFKWRLQIKRK
ncbi:hypothetical protein ACXYRQ_00995 [Mycoplasma sp. 394]|uniref:hypothetical protein n=1 Tax=Mycoplasma sp. 6243 TaxID=3440865 RepID=UPI003EB849CD